MKMIKYIQRTMILMGILILIALFVPASNALRDLFAVLLDGIKFFAKDYEYVFQMLAPLSLLGILLTWLYNRKVDHDHLQRNLASISIIDVSEDAIATIKNTSGVLGTDLLIKVYKPADFERPYGNETYLQYVANNEVFYRDKLKSLRNPQLISWESFPTIEARLFISEQIDFHLKDTGREVKENESEKWIHFAPIKIIVKDPNSDFEITRYMVFRFAHKSLTLDSDDFMKCELHPYGRWVLVYSQNIVGREKGN